MRLTSWMDYMGISSEGQTLFLSMQKRADNFYNVYLETEEELELSKELQMFGLVHKTPGPNNFVKVHHELFGFDPNDDLQCLQHWSFRTTTNKVGYVSAITIAGAYEAAAWATGNLKEDISVEQKELHLM